MPRSGDRVRPGPEARGETQVDATWGLLSPEMPNSDGSDDILDLELLRPPEWLVATGAVEGAWIWLEIDEMELSGPARVLSIRGPPEIEPSSGRVVLGTVTHLNGEVLELYLAGLAEPLDPTASHPFFSGDRGDWIAARDLVVGETLRTADGTVILEHIAAKPGIHRVYNIELGTDHYYHVSTLDILTHNSCAAGGGDVTKRPSTFRKQTIQDAWG